LMLEVTAWVHRLSALEFSKPIIIYMYSVVNKLKFQNTWNKFTTDKIWY